MMVMMKITRNCLTEPLTAAASREPWTNKNFAKQKHWLMTWWLAMQKLQMLFYQTNGFHTNFQISFPKHVNKLQHPWKACMKISQRLPAMISPRMPTNNSDESNKFLYFLMSSRISCLMNSTKKMKRLLTAEKFEQTVQKHTTMTLSSQHFLR